MPSKPAPRPDPDLVDIVWQVNQFPRRFTCPYGTDPATVIDPRVKWIVTMGFAEYWRPVGPSQPGCWYLTSDGILWLYKHQQDWPAEANATAGDARPVKAVSVPRRRGGRVKQEG